MPSFSVQTMIDTSPEAAFDLARDVDAHKRSQAYSKEEVIAGVMTGLLELGDELTFKATHFGVPFRMTAKIVEFDRPHRFVDEQVSGPFGSMRHEHTFRRDGDATLMTDTVTFSSPLGPIGRLVDSVFLEKYMRKLIENRGQALKEELEA